MLDHTQALFHNLTQHIHDSLPLAITNLTLPNITLPEDSPFSDPQWQSDVWNATSTTKEAVLLWAKVFYPVGKTSVTFLRNNPDVAGVLLVILIFWLIQRYVRKKRYVERVFEAVGRVQARIHRRYEAVLNWIRTKSRLVAMFLPHVLFTFMVLALFYMFPKQILAINTDKILFGVALGYPAVMTWVVLLFAMDSLRPNTRDETRAQIERRQKGALEKCKDWLKYWVVIGVLYALLQIPFLDQGLQLIPCWSHSQLFFAIWLVFFGGTASFYAVIAPLVLRAAPQIPDPIKYLAFGLRFVRILSEERSQQIFEFIDGGYAVLFALPFVLTPGFMTHYGCLLVGVLFPIYCSMFAISSTRILLCQRWLQYWVVFVVFMAVHEWAELYLAFLPLWYHVELVIVVWLQLPFFRGAEKLFLLLSRPSSADTNAATPTRPATPPAPTTPPAPATPNHGSNNANRGVPIEAEPEPQQEATEGLRQRRGIEASSD
eukprot:m.66315 g.66315  ORF g.66315 m.66315 type:complete len:488 (+) comp19710_c0_seq1:55-1518(+)